MFPPSTPPPAKRVKRPSSGKNEESGGWMKNILAGLYILIGIGAIVALIMMNPKEPKLVCKNSVRGSASLTTFGTCDPE